MNIKKIFSVTIATIFISTITIVPKSYASQQNEYENNGGEGGIRTLGTR